MSASEQMRAMLDQLMGTGRDGTATGPKYCDSNVCKPFLLNCCPHEILSATRMDLGECSKRHDLALRADYENAQKLKDHFYDIDAYDHLAAFVNDCDKRTEMAKKNLAETQEVLSTEVTSKANLVHDLAEQIGKKLAAAEQMGADGQVEDSMRLMEEVEDIRKKKAEAEQDYRNSMPASSYQQQKLRVCEVCLAYLGIHDNDRRLADHFGGKLHLGFIQIREKLADLKATVDERRAARREAKLKDLDGEKGNGDRDRRDRDRDRERRDRDDRRRRSRSRSRDRHRRHRSRSKSRDRHRRKRSKSRDKHKRKRSRSRDRRRRRSRSSSGDRKSRSKHDAD